jgi:long-chain acyl-CoA synthetase
LLFCYLAAAKIGAVFVPVNPNLTPSEVEYTFRHSGARVLFHDDFVAEAARSAVPADCVVPITDLRAHSTGSDQCPDLVGSDELLVIYTSGTTGTPKAIMLDHASQAQVTSSLIEMWSLSERDTTLVALPLGYLYGLTTAAAVGLLAGSKVVVLRRFHPRDVLEGLVAHSATVFHGVPTMFSMMLEYSEQRDLSFDLSLLRELICAGAPLPEEMRQRFATRFKKSIQNYYAMTEATPVFGKYSSDPRPIPSGSAGRAAPGLAIKIVRPDGSECAIGEQGELLVRAAATMKYYVDAPELTAAAMVDGYFRSGDLGHQDADGYFYITGRSKDIIIRGGANISPTEVEDVLSGHPGVQEVAVVGAPDRIFGEVPVAFIVQRHGATVTEEELMAFAEASLSEFKVPRRYFFEAELPQGKTGKVDKASLKKRCADETSAA